MLTATSPLFLDYFFFSYFSLHSLISFIAIFFSRKGCNVNEKKKKVKKDCLTSVPSTLGGSTVATAI